MSNAAEMAQFYEDNAAMVADCLDFRGGYPQFDGSTPVPTNRFGNELTLNGAIEALNTNAAMATMYRLRQLVERGGSPDDAS